MSRPTLAASAAALAAAVYVLASQPLGDPWWVYADADGSYVGSSLNIAAGGHTKYFDHPGLPLQIAGATGFAVWHAADGFPGTMHEFAGQMLAHPDRARPLYRGLTVLIYLLGATAAFIVGRRMLGAPLWGLASALLWLACPGLVPMSIQFRPDVLLSWLVLVAGALLVSGYERRDPGRLLLAAVAAGFALTTKLHAVALLPSLLLASVLSGPFPEWRADLTAWARRHRSSLGIAVAAWLAVSVYFDISQLRSTPPAKGAALVAGGMIVALVWGALGRRSYSRRSVAAFLSSFNGALVGAFLVGVLIPVTVVITDGLQSLVWVAKALAGRGVNQGVGHFTDYASLLHFPLLQASIVFVLAAVAALIGALRRDWSPALWFLASALMAVLAFERLGATHYFAPAYALAIVPALRLCRSAGRIPGALAAAALVLVVVIPQAHHVGDARKAADRAAAEGRAVERSLDQVLGAHQVALTPPDAQLPDTLYSALVASYVLWTPPYRYRTLPAVPVGAWTAEVLRLRPRLYVTAPAGRLPQSGRTTIDEYVVDNARPLDLAGYLGYRLVSGPGVDRPAPTSPPPVAPRISPP